MGERQRVVTHRTHVFIRARCAVTCQKQPGFGDEKIIQDAGDAELWIQTKPRITISPIRGVYAIPLDPGDIGTLTVMGIQFSVARMKVGMSRDQIEHRARSSIVFWDAILDGVSTLRGVQQRLQMMGFYTGAIDGSMGALTEKAVLDFQVEERNLVIDGVPGPLTQRALDDYYAQYSKVQVVDMPEGVPIVRRSFIECVRAISGPTDAMYPHPDSRGTTCPVVSYGRRLQTRSDRMRFRCNSSNDLSFAVGIKTQRGIVLNEPIYPRIDGTSVSSDYQIPPLDHDYIHKFTLTTREIGKSRVLFHYLRENGPVIGELAVDIVSMQYLNVAVHIVAIDTSAEAASHPLNEWTDQVVTDIFTKINAIWMPVGVQFSLSQIKSYRFRGVRKDTLTIHEAREIDDREPTRLSNGPSKVSRAINIYIVNNFSIMDPSGNIFPDVATAYVFRNGIFCKANVSDREGFSSTIAHELGHWLGLTRNEGRHADEAADNTVFRHDIWSRTRLMGYADGYIINNASMSPERRWQDTGYGQETGSGDTPLIAIRGGNFLTIKRLERGHVNDTDGEFDMVREIIDRPGDLYR